MPRPGAHPRRGIGGKASLPFLALAQAGVLQW
jgi:hypothetical protein